MQNVVSLGLPSSPKYYCVMCNRVYCIENAGPSTRLSYTRYCKRTGGMWAYYVCPKWTTGWCCSPPLDGHCTGLFYIIVAGCIAMFNVDGLELKNIFRSITFQIDFEIICMVTFTQFLLYVATSMSTRNHCHNGIVFHRESTAMLFLTFPRVDVHNRFTFLSTHSCPMRLQKITHGSLNLCIRKRVCAPL